MKQHLIAQTKPIAAKEQQVIVDDMRITVLTPSLIRFEAAEDKKFCDKATQIVWYRDLAKCEFASEVNNDVILIKTTAAEFLIDRKKRKPAYVILDGAKTPINNKRNLKGTARTLDMCFGFKRLDNGVIAANGVAVMRDDSLILDDDGLIKERKKQVDLYVFANKNHIAALNDFYKITGKPPMVPRYALGNWWSRYEAYTQEGYLALMDKFKAEDLPFTVATVDMDWHYVKVKDEFGYSKRRGSYMLNPGWTGYSWNKKLFPDYKKFLSELHDKNMHVTLNLHPADGVRPFEDAYKNMCEVMGVDAKSNETIPFDITSGKFIDAYFSCLHKPYESEGVDFWWMDWQQGKNTKIKGLDPLWALNHYHTLDNAFGDKRPMVLSRYAGAGSHRYPLGFSGDTVINWAVLKLEAYFTPTATNIGYTAWSHDIGGHYFGSQHNGELYLRWLQFGVFSPILRLHSSNKNIGKEPDNHPDVAETAKSFLRLRHRLIPYIYTANYANYSEGRALLEPMYYTSDDKEAYSHTRQYRFGDSLIVAPVTSPRSKATGFSTVDLWLPNGKYTNIFTGEKFEGGRQLFSCPLDVYPVFAKAGAIIPLAPASSNDWDNPSELELKIYEGNGEYELYEDGSVDMGYTRGICAKTLFCVTHEDDKDTFTIYPAKGDSSLIPQKRKYTLSFEDIRIGKLRAELNGKETPVSANGNKVEFTLDSKDKFYIELNK